MFQKEDLDSKTSGDETECGRQVCTYVHFALSVSKYL